VVGESLGKISSVFLSAIGARLKELRRERLDRGADCTVCRLATRHFGATGGTVDVRSPISAGFLVRRGGIEPPTRGFSVPTDAGADVARALRLAAEVGRWDVVERLAALLGDAEPDVHGPASQRYARISGRPTKHMADT